MLLFTMACSGAALGQQQPEPFSDPTGGMTFPFPEPEEEPELRGDVPQWLEYFGYEDDMENDGYSHSPTEEGQFEEGQVQPGQAPAARPSAGAKCDCIRCRDKLTGDWGGARTGLAKEGIIYKGRLTQFFFGVGGGVNGPIGPPLSDFGIGGGDTFEYTGNSRHDFIFDMNKLAGIPSRFVVTMENIWGRWGNVSFETGALQPPIFNSVMPIDQEASGIPYMTNFLWMQPVSENLIVSVGKTRMPSVADNNIFAGGDGSDQFVAQTFAANPLLLPQVPFSSFVISTVSPQDWGNVAFLVVDPRENATNYFEFNNLFSTGVGFLGQVQVDTEFFGLPGEHHAGFWYKNVDQIDLTFTPVPPTYPYSEAPPGFATKTETYSLFYGFDQYVTTYGPPDARGKSEGWGIFGRAGIADGGTGNPSFGAWHASLGIGGDSPLPGRQGKGDRFGFGYAYTATSSQYGPIPIALLGPRDAQNVELFYRYRLTPSIEITPDVQFVRGMLGGLTNGDNAVVAGIRLNMHL